jgi:hypothetical protein
VIAIESIEFPNVYLRLDITHCSETNFCNCASAVNLQFGMYGWEKFKLVRQSNGSYCIQPYFNNNIYLSFDASSCTVAVGPGCGSWNAVYNTSGTCSGKEAFRFVNLGSNRWAVRSDWKPNAYMRADGRSITYFNVENSGTVNGQLWENEDPRGYEVFKIHIQ